MAHVALGAATRVHYVTTGAPATPQTPDLVLIHGTGGSAQTHWAHLMEPLSAGERRVIAIDLSGSGETTDDGEPLTLARLTAQVHAMIDDAGARPFDLLGYSLGACVAAHVASGRPPGLRRLILLSGWLDSTVDPRFAVQFGLWRHLHETDRRALAEYLALTGFSAQYLSGRPAKATEQAIRNTVATLAPGFVRQCELDLRVDLASAAPNVGVPTLALVSLEDQMVPPHHGRALGRAIPGAELGELPSGHLSIFEVPALLTERVLGFLHSARPPAAPR